MKLAVVGGGSTYTPELIEGIATRPTELAVDEIVLVDPNQERVEVVGEFSRRLLSRCGHPATLRTTADLEEAAEGAAAVLLQLRVGGQSARLGDESFPHECGCIGQETTGAGGLAKALRTVPVVLDIARRVREVTDGWIVNFTNPVGIVTRALLQEGRHAVGLCNVAITFQRWVAALLGHEPDDVRLEHVGLNHLTWERGVRIGDEDVLSVLLNEKRAALAEHIGLPEELLRRLNAVPSPYLRYFYAHDDMLERQRTSEARADRVSAVERELMELYADPTVNTKPELLAQRGGAYYSEAAVRLVRALTTADSVEEHVVNVRNGTTLPFLPPDAVIETNADVTSSGASARQVGPLDPGQTGLVAHVTGYEFLALDAALRGGRDRVADALLAHPLVGQHALADRLADALIARNAAYLPWVKA